MFYFENLNYLTYEFIYLYKYIYYKDQNDKNLKSFKSLFINALK